MDSTAKKHKKRRRKSKKSGVNVATEEIPSNMPHTDLPKALLDLQKSLKLSNKELFQYMKKRFATESNDSQRSHIVPSKYGVKARPEPELVVYESPVKRQRNSAGESHQTTKEMDLSKAKWDVRRFGTSGLTGANKEESKLEMLVKLGAKRPKPKPRNYKEILEEKTKEKEERKRLIKEREMFGDVTGETSQKLKKKRSVNRLGKNEVKGKSSFGQIGVNRHGSQIISQRDIKRIKKSRR